MTKILIDEAVVRQAIEWIGDPHTRTVSAGKMVSILIEALAEQPAQRCPLCNYQHGHAIGCTNNPVDIALDKMAENARELGLSYEQPAPAQQGQAIDVAFLRQVLSVAICGLFDHYKDDVLRVFTLDELQKVVDLSDALRPRQVEDIYKQAWLMLSAPPAPAPAQPEFFTHSVDAPYDWSEWVCPDPKGYLMKCCDCGLVHEVEFGVVRYQSETEREDCEMVDDPNLQAVFRMRRSEQWSPVDTAHRAGGLPVEQPEPAQPCKYGNEPASCRSSPMDCQCEIDAFFEQPAPAQEPVAKVAAKEGAEWWQSEVERYAPPPAPAQQCVCGEPETSGTHRTDGPCYAEQPAPEPDPDELTIAYMSGLHEGKKRKPWVGLTDKELDLLGAPWHFNLLVGEERKQVRAYIRAVEAKLKEKNT
jgi:hypothetical protein